MRARMRVAGRGKDERVIRYEIIRNYDNARLIWQHRTVRLLPRQAVFRKEVKRPRKENASAEARLIHLHPRRLVLNPNRHNCRDSLQLARFAEGFFVYVESTLQFSIATMP